MRNKMLPVVGEQIQNLVFRGEDVSWIEGIVIKVI